MKNTILILILFIFSNLAEANQVREEFRSKNKSDIDMINARFGETQALIRVLIKEKK